MQMATKQDQQTTPEHQSSKKKRSWKSLLLKAAFTGFCMLFSIPRIWIGKSATNGRPNLAFTGRSV